MVVARGWPVPCHREDQGSEQDGDLRRHSAAQSRVASPRTPRTGRRGGREAWPRCRSRGLAARRGPHRPVPGESRAGLAVQEPPGSQPWPLGRGSCTGRSSVPSRDPRGWTMTSASLHPPPPAPSCFDGRKNFQLFLLYFSRRVTRSGKEFPLPKPPPGLGTMPQIQAHPAGWDGGSYFWVPCGGGAPGEGMWGCRSSFQSCPLPAPPRPHGPRRPGGGRKPAQLRRV